MRSLSEIDVREGYVSDEDDILRDFFIPCYDRCTEYDRCVEYLSIDMLKTTFNKYEHFKDGTAKLRVVTGHRFRPVDLDLIIMLFSKSRNPFEKRNIKDDGLRHVRKAFENGQIEIKIAISNSQIVEEAIPERIGIFKDGQGHSVAYVSSAKSSFGTRGGGFEIIDAYTSWSDPARVKRKARSFEKLWLNKMPHTDVYEFEQAVKKGQLMYWRDWILHD